MNKSPYPRTRTKDRRVSVTRTGVNSVGPWSVTVPKAAGSYEVMEDVVTPGWQKTVYEGGILMNRMYKYKAELTHGQTGSCSFQQPPNVPPTAYYNTGFGNFCTGRGHDGGTWWGLPGFNLVTPQETADVVTEACTRCLSQIGRSSTDTWENLAEADKTLDLLRNPLSSWFKFEKKARIATAAMSAAQAWLVYRYGVRPLVLSVDEVLKEMKKKTRPIRTTTRASAFTQKSSSEVYSTTPSYWSVAKLSYTLKRTEALTVRAMSIDEAISEFASTYGFSGKSLVTLPWELVPYSFVADWAFNIGDFLGAVAQSFNSRSLGQCHTLVADTLDYRVSAGTVAWDPSSIGILSPFVGWSQVYHTSRDRRVGLAAPGLVVKQDFRFDKATRIADAFALVAQQVTRAFAGRK